MPDLEKAPLLVDQANVDLIYPSVNSAYQSVSEIEISPDHSIENPNTTLTSSTVSTRSRRSRFSDSDSNLKYEEQHGTTNVETLIHLFKGNIGTGILGLPTAILHAGLIVGPVLLLLIALMSVHCMHLIVRCSHSLCRRLNKDAMDYGDVAEECLRPYLRERARWGRIIVNIFLIITQLGFCSVYFMFVADNFLKASQLHIDVRIIMAALAVPVVILSYIRSLEKLAYLSMIANVLCVVGLIITYQYLARHLHSPSEFKPFAGWSKLPLFFGTAIFSFEGIGVVLPLENEMKRPEDFGWVLNVGMGIVTILFVSMGLFGYLTFGHNLKGSVTLNLPDYWLYDAMEAGYALAMFLTYFLQFYVPMQIMLPKIRSKVPPKGKNCVEYLFRTFCVLLTCGIAIGIPQLDNFISLLGAVSSSALAIIFPPLFHILTFRGEGLTIFGFFKDILIIVIGFLGFIFGTYTAILAIITGFEIGRVMRRPVSPTNHTVNANLSTFSPAAGNLSISDFVKSIF